VWYRAFCCAGLADYIRSNDLIQMVIGAFDEDAWVDRFNQRQRRHHFRRMDQPARCA
jgi:hypothetical protein